MGLIVDMKQVTTTARLTKGTVHLSLPNDEVCGVCTTDQQEVCVITTKGYAKRCELDEILVGKKRKADMIRLTSLGEGDQVFKITPMDPRASHGTKLMVYMANGGKVELSESDIRLTTRLSKGYKTIPVKRGDSIARIRWVSK